MRVQERKATAPRKAPKPHQNPCPTQNKSWERRPQKELWQGKRQENVLDPDHFLPLRELRSGTPRRTPMQQKPKAEAEPEQHKTLLPWPPIPS